MTATGTSAIERSAIQKISWRIVPFNLTFVRLPHVAIRSNRLFSAGGRLYWTRSTERSDSMQMLLSNK